MFAATLWLGIRLSPERNPMDLHKMIAELQAERQRLDEAIAALERLSAGKQFRRRGRRPRWLAEEIQRQSAAEAESKKADR